MNLGSLNSSKMSTCHTLVFFELRQDFQHNELLSVYLSRKSILGLLKRCEFFLDMFNESFDPVHKNDLFKL